MRHCFASAGLFTPLVAAVILGGAFGEASAEGRALSSGQVQVEITVEVADAQTVVAHIIEPGGGQETVPLVNRGNDRYSTTVEVRKADFVIVFEALGDALSVQSQPVRLTELGLDPTLIGALPTTTTTTELDRVYTRQWGWAGLALAALSLAFLAWWALPDRTRRSDDKAPPPDLSPTS